MKRVYIALTAALLLASCRQASQEPINAVTSQRTVTWEEIPNTLLYASAYIVTVDGREYLLIETYSHGLAITPHNPDTTGR